MSHGMTDWEAEEIRSEMSSEFERTMATRAEDVAQVLEWCGRTGKLPHQNFQFDVRVTNAAGRIRNAWEEDEELRNHVCDKLARNVRAGRYKTEIAR